MPCNVHTLKGKHIAWHFPNRRPTQDIGGRHRPVSWNAHALQGNDVLDTPLPSPKLSIPCVKYKHTVVQADGERAAGAEPVPLRIRRVALVNAAIGRLHVPDLQRAPGQHVQPRVVRQGPLVLVPGDGGGRVALDGAREVGRLSGEHRHVLGLLVEAGEVCKIRRRMGFYGVLTYLEELFCNKTSYFMT